MAAPAQNTRKHKNRWAFESTLRLAYQGVGAAARSGRAGELGQTRRVLECLVAHAALAQQALRRGMRCVFAPTGVVVINRAADSTPRLLSFGQLSGVLAGHARYLCKKADGQGWDLLSLDRWQALHPRCRPKFGVLEVFAQLCSVHWQTAEGRWNENYFVQPCVLQAASASNMQAALEVGVPELTICKLQEIAAQNTIVILHETMDSCKANNRLSAYRCKALPTRVLYVKMPCAAHLIHLAIVNGPPATAEDKVIGDVYAFEYVGRISTHFNAMLRSLRAFLEEHIVVIDDGRAPSHDARLHLEQLLEYTVRRGFAHVRGSLPLDSEETVFAGHEDASVNRACEKLLLVFNGDPCLPYPVHVKVAETRHLSKQEIVDMAVDAVLDARLLPGCVSSLPSKNRWGTMQVCLERQVAGFLLHNIAGSVAERTFRTWEDGDAPGDDDVRLLVQKKGWRVRCYVQDSERRRRACLTLFCCLPLDHLWRHLQHCEERGAALMDLGIPHLNGFTAACRAYCNMAASDAMQGPLAPYFHYWGPPGTEGHETLLSETRLNLLQRAAHVWFRLEVPMKGFPFRLCGVVDVRLGFPAKQQIASDVYTTPLCCLDRGFTRKVRLGEGWVFAVVFSLRADQKLEGG